MAVYKSKRGESSVQFIETARQLEAHTLACCMKAPKRYSFLLTQRIMDTASEVHDHVRAANNIWPTNRHEAQLRRDELPLLLRKIPDDANLARRYESEDAFISALIAKTRVRLAVADIACEPPPGRFEVIVANLYGGLLLQCAPAIAAAAEIVPSPPPARTTWTEASAARRASAASMSRERMTSTLIS